MDIKPELNDCKFYELGQVSPRDFYLARMTPCELAHGVYADGKMQWFSESSDPREVFAILLCCTRYRLAHSIEYGGMSPEERGPMTYQTALDRMFVLCPGFRVTLPARASPESF